LGASLRRWATPMRSLDVLRSLLPPTLTVTDEELLETAQQMETLSRMILRLFLAKRADATRALRLLPRDEADDVVERAAIMEFDGNVSRDEAERRAFTALLSDAAKRH
jgi:hypothetical protein